MARSTGQGISLGGIGLGIAAAIPMMLRVTTGDGAFGSQKSFKKNELFKGADAARSFLDA